MRKRTFGMMICKLRRQKSMTQLNPAKSMGVAGKTVLKWESDISFADVSADELMQIKSDGACKGSPSCFPY